MHIILPYILSSTWLWFDISSVDDSGLRNILQFKLQLSVILVLLCLASLFVNKKIIMMMIWILSIIYIEKNYMIFPQYEQYLAYTDCIDSSKVWDYNEHIVAAQIAGNGTKNTVAIR